MTPRESAAAAVKRTSCVLERVHTAEEAIFNRLQELAQSSDSPDHKAERHAIEELWQADAFSRGRS
jgi:hypothetical protein